MPGLRTPTALFVILTLVPATILAWLGWRASAPWVEELRRNARDQVERMSHEAAARCDERMRSVDAGLQARLLVLAAEAARMLPGDSPGRGLLHLEADLGPAALELVAANGRRLLPRGPGSLDQSWLPEWPRWCGFRDQLGAQPVSTDQIDAARAFEAPALRALALALVLRERDTELAAELRKLGRSALVDAGPLPVELLCQSDTGRALLAEGPDAGWLLEIAATEAARSRWLRAAGADPELCARQELRAVREGGGRVLVLRAEVVPQVALELLRDPEVALVALDLGTADCALELLPAPAPAPLMWTGMAAARTAVASPWGPVWIAASHRHLPDIERSAGRQRLWTAVGIGLLLVSSAAGVGLARRALLRERAARQLRDDFIANVSHELKTPLTSLRLYADMLAADALGSTERARYGAVAQAEGARLSALIDDLLDFSALERGRRRIEAEPVDLRAAVEAVAEAWQPRAVQLGVELLRPALRDEVPALADPKALLRILTNLLQNAFRHGRPARDGGRSRIAVAVGPGPALEVRDNGPGVPAADRERIFGRFERAASGGEGAGIGLAISRELAQACGGRLLCTDDGAHTVFRLELPPVPELGACAT